MMDLASGIMEFDDGGVYAVLTGPRLHSQVQLSHWPSLTHLLSQTPQGVDVFAANRARR